MGWADIRDRYVVPAAATVAGGPLLGQVVGAQSGSFSDIPVVGDVVGGLTGQTAADAATQAANIQAQAQQSQLDYLKEINRLPQQYREGALAQLANIYGIGGGGGFLGGATTAGATTLTPGQSVTDVFNTGITSGDGTQATVSTGNIPGLRPGFSVDQAALIEQAQMSPLYQQLLGGRGAGEEAILRQASATGGLRSGNVQEALYDYNVQLENQALTQAYNQALQDKYTEYQTGESQYGQYLSGLQGLAGIEGYNPEIAQTIGNIGATQAAGITGAAQAQQQGISNILGLAGTLGGAALLGPLGGIAGGSLANIGNVGINYPSQTGLYGGGGGYSIA